MVPPEFQSPLALGPGTFLYWTRRLVVRHHQSVRKLIDDWASSPGL